MLRANVYRKIEQSAATAKIEVTFVSSLYRGIYEVSKVLGLIFLITAYFSENLGKSILLAL